LLEVAHFEGRPPPPFGKTPTSFVSHPVDFISKFADVPRSSWHPARVQLCAAKTGVGSHGGGPPLPPSPAFDEGHSDGSTLPGHPAAASATSVIPARRQDELVALGRKRIITFFSRGYRR
jgi:hypothetical protein